MTSNTNNDVILSVRNLKTCFFTSDGIVKAVNDVSFDIKKGEILGIVGESGAGKSVIAFSILRLVPYPGKIVGGEIFFKGANLLALSDAQIRGVRGAGIGIIFQDPMSCLNPVFTIEEQITRGIRTNLGLSRHRTKEKAIEMLKLVNISDPERRIRGYQHELSGGMKQRTMIAIALSCDPELLIADNPTTALDSTIQLQFLNLILDLRRRLGMTILYISHNLGTVARICDRVGVLYAGEIIELGSVYNVLKNPKHPYTSGLIAATPTPGMSRIDAIEGRPPDLTSLPTGCKFASRCEFAGKECSSKDMELIDVGTKEDSHLVRCRLRHL